jgi:hypothetical protein
MLHEKSAEKKRLIVMRSRTGLAKARKGAPRTAKRATKSTKKVKPLKAKNVTSAKAKSVKGGFVSFFKSGQKK